MSWPSSKIDEKTPSTAIKLLDSSHQTYLNGVNMSVGILNAPNELRAVLSSEVVHWSEAQVMNKFGANVGSLTRQKSQHVFPTAHMPRCWTKCSGTCKGSMANEMSRSEEGRAMMTEPRTVSHGAKANSGVYGRIALHYLAPRT